MVSAMLQLFRDGVPSYQPEAKGLVLESGDPQASLENLGKIMAAGLMIRDILVSPTGVLVMFASGEHHYAPGLRVGTDGPATDALVEIAAKAGFGPAQRLLRFYRHLPASYSGQLPTTAPDDVPNGVLR